MSHSSQSITKATLGIDIWLQDFFQCIKNVDLDTLYLHKNETLMKIYMYLLVFLTGSMNTRQHNCCTLLVWSSCIVVELAHGLAACHRGHLHIGGAIASPIPAQCGIWLRVMSLSPENALVES